MIYGIKISWKFRWYDWQKIHWH